MTAVETTHGGTNGGPAAVSSPAGLDESILGGVRAGDESAYELMIRTHGPHLLATARRLLHNDDDAAEVLQESFLSAFRALPAFEHKSSLGTWLHRIVVNHAVTRLRRRRRKHEISIDEFLPEFLDDGHQRNPAVEWGGAVESRLINSETRALVRESIDRLPERYRTVLILRDIEELDTREVAHLLRVSIGAVKTRLHRAHQALRELLDPHLRSGDL